MKICVIREICERKKLFCEKTGSVVGFHPEHLESLLVFRELIEVSLGELCLNLFFVGRVDEGDAGTLEAGSRETATPNARQFAHRLIDGNQLGAATFVVVDGAFAGIEGKLSKQLHISCFPSSYALAYATVFAVEMLGTTSETGRHGDARLLKRGLGNVAEEGLVEGLQRLVGIGQHVPCSRLALVDPEVVVAIDEASREAAEEDADHEGEG